MNFTSLSFLLCFLPVFLVVLKVSPQRTGLLLASSLAFYLLNSSLASFAYFVSLTLFNYAFAVALFRQAVPANSLFALGLLVNLTPLLLFKYLPFFQERGVFPLGASFYTFQNLSFLIDVRRQQIKALPSLSLYLNYISFFPQLIAGPVVRFHQICDQLRPGRIQFHSTHLLLGFQRFNLGLGKKVILADSLAVPVDAIFALPQTDLSAALCWLGGVLFTLQIYFDFSGYSDMAIGLARMIGLELPENFHRPFAATSLKEFWSRWHITLTSWFRDYLFYPVFDPLRSHGFFGYATAILVTFFLSGAWHGSALNFVIWGLIHGILVLMESALRQETRSKIPVLIRRIYLLFAVTTSFVVFRARTFEQMIQHLKNMFWETTSLNLIPTICNRHTFLFLGLSILFLLTERRIEKRTASLSLVTLVISLVCFVWALSHILEKNHEAFIYFQF